MNIVRTTSLRASFASDLGPYHRKQICADFHTIRESLQSSQLRLSADGQRLARAAA